MISSASSAASSGSWVTITVLDRPRAGGAQLAAQALAHRGVEAREGLVEQQQARFARERAGERDAPLLAAGELVGVAVLEPRQAEPLEPPGGQRGLGAGAEGDLPPDRAPRQQRRLLGHVADLAPLGGQAVAARARRRERVRRRRRHQPGEQAQREGLAGAGGAEQRQARARCACGRPRARSRQALAQARSPSRPAAPGQLARGRQRRGARARLRRRGRCRRRRAEHDRARGERERDRAASSPAGRWRRTART